EELCAGSRGARLADWSERLRRAADLEHWASFRKSFERLGALLVDVGSGKCSGSGRPPSSINVLSGDVHHAYIARAHFPEPVTTPTYQIVCSPLHNYVPWPMRQAFRGAWSRAAEGSVHRLLGVVSTVPETTLSWQRLCGPFYGNEIATLVLEGRRAEMILQ